MDTKSVPGYKIWKDQWDCTQFSYRWAKDGFADNGLACQNHGGATSIESAILAAKGHKKLIDAQEA